MATHFLPFDLMFYDRTNRLLVWAFEDDLEELKDRWADEISEAALAGNPQRAGYIEWMIGRIP